MSKDEKAAQQSGRVFKSTNGVVTYADGPPPTAQEIDALATAFDAEQVEVLKREAVLVDWPIKKQVEALTDLLLFNDSTKADALKLKIQAVRSK